MSRAFDSVMQGLQEAVAHASGKQKTGIKVHKPKAVNVKRLRARLRLTQPEFAAMFGINLGTLRHWECGDRQPRGAALVLLNVISKDPVAVIRALSG